MRLLQLLSLLLLFTQSSYAQQGSLHWSYYVVSKTLDTAHLPRLTDKEKEMQKRQKKEQAASEKRYDSLEQEAKHQPPEELDSIGEEARNIQDKMIKEDAEKARISDSLHPEFAESGKQLMIDNKTSVTLTKNSLGKDDYSGIIDFATICQTYLINDTLLIGAGVGFMAGEGVEIRIYKNQFSARFGSSADGDSVFKKNLSDATYKDNIEIAATHQQLTLLAKPTFKRGEIICGYLEADFEPIYEREHRNEKPVGKVNHAKIFFRSKIE